MSNSGIGKKNN